MSGEDKEEFIVLKQDVKHIKQDVRDIKANSDILNKTMTKLTSKLFKDDDTGDVGYLELTKRNGIRLTKLENLKAIGYGVLFALGIIFGWYLKIFKK